MCARAVRVLEAVVVAAAVPRRERAGLDLAVVLGLRAVLIIITTINIITIVIAIITIIITIMISI